MYLFIFIERLQLHNINQLFHEVFFIQVESTEEGEASGSARGRSEKTPTGSPKPALATTLLPRLSALSLSLPLPSVPEVHMGKALPPWASAGPIGCAPAGIKGQGTEPMIQGFIMFILRVRLGRPDTF